MKVTTNVTKIKKSSTTQIMKLVITNDHTKPILIIYLKTFLLSILLIEYLIWFLQSIHSE